MLGVPALSPSALTQDTLRRMGLSIITNNEWGRNGSSSIFYTLHTFRSDPPHLVIQSHSTRLRPRSSEGSVPRSTGLWLSQMLRVPALSPSALTQDTLRRMGLSMITNNEWGRNGSSSIFYTLHTFRSDPPHLVILRKAKDLCPDRPGYGLARCFACLP